MWGDMVGQVIRRDRRKQFHKQRLIQLFRELRRSTAALPDGVIILSTQREIVWFNRQAARLLGLKRPMDLGLRIDNLIRSPEFVLYLHGDDFAMPLVIRRTATRRAMPAMSRTCWSDCSGMLSPAPIGRAT